MQAMTTGTDNTNAANQVHALVQLLRSRSSDEIRQRMYDSPPGSHWWSACKTELDLRNSEQMTTALVDTSHVMDKLGILTERLDVSTDKLLQATSDTADLLK